MTNTPASFTYVRSLPRRNENSGNLPPITCATTASEAYLEGMKTLHKALVSLVPFWKSEAYLEGMKTHSFLFRLRMLLRVRSLPRRNENCTSSTNRIREPPLVRSLPRRNENYFFGTQQCTVICIVRSLPRRNENLSCTCHFPPVCTWSEAYLEGMKTSYCKYILRRKDRSEAYLEGMKTSQLLLTDFFRDSPKPTSKE